MKRTLIVVTYWLRMFINNFLLVPQRFFLIMALLFGLPLIIFRPAYDVPDFGTHLARAYSVSEGHLVATTLNMPVYNPQATAPKGYKYMGDIIPLSVAQIATTSLPSNGSLIGNKVPAKGQFHLYSEPEIKKVVPFAFNTVAIYNPITYFPQAVSLAVGRWLGLSVYSGVLLASIVDFILWLVAIRAAIQITPIGKWLIATLNLLPMTLFLTTSISPDSLLFGAIFLLFAYLMFLLKDKRPQTTKRLMLLLVLLVLVACLKETYFVLAFASLALLERFNSRKRAALWLLLLCTLPIIVVGLWVLVTTRANFLIVPWSQPHTQEVFMLHHPLSVTKITARTLLFGADGVVWSFFGILGWLTLPIPLIAVILLAMGFVIALGIERRFIQLTMWQKLVLFVTLLANIILILASLFVYWTPPGLRMLEGLQGRYFIPLAILIVPIVAGYRIMPKNQNKAIVTLEMIILIALVTTGAFLYRAYYLV